MTVEPKNPDEGQMDEEQLEDVAGGIGTVPLTERTPGDFTRVVKKKTTITRPGL